jgi:hypothetical protein
MHDNLPQYEPWRYACNMTLHNDDDPELEFSPLSGIVTRDGVSVRVEIYRLTDRNEGWTLEVIDHEDASTVWDDTFASEKPLTPNFIARLNARAFAHSLNARQDGQIRLAFPEGPRGPFKDYLVWAPTGY